VHFRELDYVALVRDPDLRDLLFAFGPALFQERCEVTDEASPELRAAVQLEIEYLAVEEHARDASLAIEAQILAAIFPARPLQQQSQMFRRICGQSPAPQKL
jgi:hypothetical protein